jgi:hypothetical protein
MNDLKKTVRKISEPTSPAKGITVIPDTEGLLADGLHILQAELMRYRHKVNSGRSLDLKEARIMKGYLECLVKLSEESRKRDKESDLESLSIDELVQLVSKIKDEKK